MKYSVLKIVLNKKYNVYKTLFLFLLFGFIIGNILIPFKKSIFEPTVYLSNIVILLCISIFFIIKKSVIDQYNRKNLLLYSLMLYILFIGLAIIELRYGNKILVDIFFMKSYLSIFIWITTTKIISIFLKSLYLHDQNIKSKIDKIENRNNSLSIIIVILSSIFYLISKENISLIIFQLLPLLIIIDWIKLSTKRCMKNKIEKYYILGMYILLAGMSLQIGITTTNRIEYICIFNQFFILAAFLSIGYQNFVKVAISFRNLNQLTIELSRKMGELNFLQIEAQKSEKEKERFLAIMSHEIRTPVNGIIGNTELLETTNISDEQIKFLEMIKVSTNNLMKLIEEILDLPNIISKRIKISKNEFSIIDLIEEIIDVVTPKSFEKCLDLNYYLDLSLPNLFYGDAKRIEQVLLNLANNGLKFTENGEVFISVKKQSIKDNTCSILFEVKDTGPGIAPEKLKEIFSPYSQADKSINRKYGGTGLGLSIVAQLVEAMGGKIWAESNIKEGAKFFFVLELPISVNAKEGDFFQKFKNVTVLAMTECKSTEYIFKRYFQNWGITYNVTNSIYEAKSFAREGSFNLAIITDFQQETIDDIHSLKDILLKNNSKAKILFFSGISEEIRQDIVKISDLNLSKPIKVKCLYEGIKSLTEDNQDKTNKESMINKNNILYKHNNLLINISNVKKLTILVAEDNIVNQKIIFNILNKLGHDVTVVDNGLKAVEYTNKHSYDLVIMDLQMPIMDGLDATKKIKNKFKNSLKIFALTANAMVGDREKCLEAGMDDYLAKPVQVKVLKDMLDKWFLEKKSAI